MNIRSVAIYCFENPATADLEKTGSQDHLAAAILLGEELARRGITLITGGMSTGLMGVVTNAALQAGGRVIGIVPKDFPIENRHLGLSEVHIVEDAYDRKRLMMRLSDASVTLGGGYGTCSELFNELDIMKEMAKGYASAKQYGVSPDRPVVIFDPDGFYAPIGALAQNMGRVKKNAKDVNKLKIATNIRQALLQLGAISPEEYNDTYSAYAQQFKVSLPENIDAQLKPISPATRKREFRYGSAIMMGGLASLVLACLAPRMIPGAMDARPAQMDGLPIEETKPLSEVELRSMNYNDVVRVWQGTLPLSGLPEHERLTFEKMKFLAQNPPSLPQAAASDASLAAFLLGISTLLAGSLKRGTARNRPTIIVPLER